MRSAFVTPALDFMQRVSFWVSGAGKSERRSAAIRTAADMRQNLRVRRSLTMGRVPRGPSRRPGRVCCGLTDAAGCGWALEAVAWRGVGVRLAATGKDQGVSEFPPEMFQTLRTAALPFREQYLLPRLRGSGSGAVPIRRRLLRIIGSNFAEKYSLAVGAAVGYRFHESEPHHTTMVEFLVASILHSFWCLAKAPSSCRILFLAVCSTIYASPVAAR